MKASGYSTSEIRSRAVQALVKGMSVMDVASAYCVDRTTLFRWRRRYEVEGDAGLDRRGGSGRPRKWTELSDADVWYDIILQPASAFGFETDLWTVRRVHQVLRTEYAAAMSRDTVWRRLREEGLTYQKPERQYFELNEAARQEWLQIEVPRIRAAVEKYRAILYFQDESNISLTALLGKTWAPCGETPTVRVTGKRGGVSAMIISARAAPFSTRNRSSARSDEREINDEATMQRTARNMTRSPATNIGGRGELRTSVAPVPFRRTAAADPAEYDGRSRIKGSRHRMKTRR